MESCGKKTVPWEIRKKKKKKKFSPTSATNYSEISDSTCIFRRQLFCSSWWVVRNFFFQYKYSCIIILLKSASIKHQIIGWKCGSLKANVLSSSKNLVLTFDSLIYCLCLSFWFQLATNNNKFKTQTPIIDYVCYICCTLWTIKNSDFWSGGTHI